MVPLTKKLAPDDQLEVPEVRRLATCLPPLQMLATGQPQHVPESVRRQLVACDIGLVQHPHTRRWRLRAPMHFIDPQACQALARLMDMHCFWTIDSTSSWLLRRAEHLSAERNTACVAEHQWAGRGRSLGKVWQSPLARNLYLSLAHRLHVPVAEAATVSLAAGVMCCRALVSLGISDLRLKWPNDLYLAEKKLGGILVETAQGGADTILVVGIGINCDMSADAGQRIDQAWTDLATHTRTTPVDRTLLLQRVATHINELLTTWNARSWAMLREEWRAHDMLLGQALTLTRPNGTEMHATGAGIADSGALMYRDAHGTLHSTISGEVHVRPRLGVRYNGGGDAQGDKNDT